MLSRRRNPLRLRDFLFLTIPEPVYSAHIHTFHLPNEENTLNIAKNEQKNIAFTAKM